MEVAIYQSKIAVITIVAESNYVCNINFNTQKTYNKQDSDIIDKTIVQLSEYFNGNRRKFELPIQISGSVFEIDVLKAILKIPYGKTVSYKELATLSGHPKAIRAVATVCRKNKLPILIPCHRVIRSDGLYGNYSGGNQIKSELITLENIYNTD